MSDLKVSDIRTQFPVLNREFGGKLATFYDGPAGTQVPQRVIDSIGAYMSTSFANGGGEFTTSRETVEMVAKTRRACATFFGATEPNEIVFGQNMTSLTFSLSRSIANTWKDGDEIIVTRLDHEANIIPWTSAAKEKGVKVHFIDFHHDDCRLNIEQFKNTINERTKLVAIGAACNATGGINPVKQLTELAHSVGAIAFVDAVHYAPHLSIDVAEWGCDFVACSAYKFFGPHLGILWGKSDLLEKYDSYNARPPKAKLASKWMTGTQSFELIAGTLGTLEYLCSLVNGANDISRPNVVAAFDAISRHERALAEKMFDCLSSFDELEIFGIKDKAEFDQRTATFSIRHPKYSSRQLAKVLGENSIFVWYGNYYALEFSENLGAEPNGFVRVGLVHYNTLEEIDCFQQQLAELFAKSHELKV